MNWNTLNNIDELNTIDAESTSGSVLILKHSTSCSISSTALGRLERKWKQEDNGRLKPYYLDLLQHRDVSNQIAQRYGVVHESPQVLVIRDGKCIYHTSHLDISYEQLMSVA